MTKPNFLIIGAPKCGTTSLYNYLAQHPNVEFSDIKEPKYFSFKDDDLNYNSKSNTKVLEQLKASTIQNLENYLDLFKDKTADFIGEASPNYFHFEPAAKNIYEFNPKMKMILILRNPVDRLYSDWKHNVRMGYDPIFNFKKSMGLIEFRKKENYPPYFNYLEKGNYSKHLKRFYTFFSKNQIKIILYEDFKKNANKECNEVLTFLGIEKTFQFQTSKIYMKSTPISKCKIINKITNFIKPFNGKLSSYLKKMNSITEEMPEIHRQFGLDYYENDIKEFEKVTGKELTSWYK